MDKKKIEPTDAMVDIVDLADKLMATDTRGLLRYALNHPDAPRLFADEDDRPWEPLGDDEPLSVGDEVKRAHHGLTTIAVVGGVDKCGNPRTAGGSYIGNRLIGTWYVRRPAQPLPPERDGVVLVPADGHEAITTADGQAFSRLTFTMKQGIWYGPNLAQLGEYVIQTTSLSRLIPGTWKVGDQ